MLLSNVLSQYVLEHDLRPCSVEQLEISISRYSAWLTRRATVDDLTADSVNAWIMFLQSGQARETVRSKRRSILTLWQFAFDAGLVDHPPQRIRKIRPGDSLPEAWTLAQLGDLLAECGRLTGVFRKLALPRSLYMTSLVNAKYDSGLRIGDMQSIERTWIWPTGIVSLVQHKPGRQHTARLRETTLAQIDELMELMPDRRLIWPAFSCRRRFFEFFSGIVERAGLHGSSKFIRRSSASYYEREHPGEAWRHLGHAAPGLDRRSYLDPRICYPPPALPPAIEKLI